MTSPNKKPARHSTAETRGMRAAVLERFGSPLQLRDVARPTPGNGEVLVRVQASGVNPLDLKIAAGQADHAKQVLPAILGIDLAGTVEAVGADVTAFRPGDEVYGMTGGVGGIAGSLAEYAAVDAALLAKKPHNLTMREAAALPLIVITAWEGLVDRAGLSAANAAGKKVLVHGGGGGVGHVAIQLARAFGADVFASESAPKRSLVERFGATFIDYNAETVEAYVTAHTGGEGFDIIYDTVGGATLDASFAAVRRYQGHVVSCLGWGAHRLAPLSFRAATYSGVFTLLPLLTGKGRAHHGEIMRRATELVEAGKLLPVLDPRHFTLETAMEAHAAMKDHSAKGKIVVEIG
ncbi:MAG TPA: zinc-dependent alcohol dehydrogenase family protein [Dongiaceae bacterium]|nr:zinc-dependent alcohol dehydrogenase family protein [Dongiaceae bacterium]